MCLTLKADVLPVCPIARTVQPATNQPLVNGLEDAHVDCLAVLHRACIRHTDECTRKGHISGLLETLTIFTPAG